MSREQERLYQDYEDFSNKKNTLRKEQSVRDKSKKRKALKIREGIDRYYVVRRDKGGAIDDDFDIFDDSLIH